MPLTLTKNFGIIIFFSTFINIGLNYYSEMITRQNFTKIFPTHELIDPQLKSKVLFRSLWEENDRKLYFVTFLRRFGWSICRLGAKELSEDLKFLNKKFPDLLTFSAVGVETLGYEEFAEMNFFSEGKIYVDQGKYAYDTLNFIKPGLTSGYGLMDPQVWIKNTKAQKEGACGNFKGDGFQMGGSFIIDNKGDIIYAHLQKSYVETPVLYDMITAIERYNLL